MTRNGADGRDVPRRRVLEAGAALSGSALLSSGGAALESRRSDPALDASSVPAQTETAGTIGCGETVTGEVTPDDEDGFLGEGYYADFYGFDGADAFVTASLRAECDRDAGYGPWPLLYLLDSNGIIVAEGTIEYEVVDGTDYMYSQIAAFRPSGAGPYTLVASSYSPETTFEYQLSVDCLTLQPEATIECGESVSAALTADDPSGFSGRNRLYDVYALPVTAGDLVELEVNTPDPYDSGAPDDPSLGEPYLFLLSPAGEIVAEGQFDWYTGELSAAIGYYAPDGGEYTVVVSSYGPNDEFEYELTTACQTPPEPTRVECGQTVTGEFTLDDPPSFFDEGDGYFEYVQDTYRFQGTAGEEATVALNMSDNYGYGYARLYLLAPDGSPIAESDYAGSSVLVSHVLPETGEYTVVASGELDSYYDELLGYELSVGCGEPFACPVECDDAIECGQTVVDGLDATDDTTFRGPNFLHDAYCFDAEAGDVVTVSMATADFGYEEPYLYLLGPNGAVVAQNQYGGGYGNAVIQSYEVRETGEYKIVATSAYDSSLFEYTLALQCE